MTTSSLKTVCGNFLNVLALFAIILVHVQPSHGAFIDTENFIPWAPSWYTDRNRTLVPLSTPEECARKCTNNGKPLNCYYFFYIEFYTTIGPACNTTGGQSQCIIADGYEKTMLSINRQMPGPQIQGCKNDRMIIDVHNAGSGMEVTIHWHGIFQKGYQYYDGVPYLTQCPIPSSTTFRYDFVVKNSGTFFYHSHLLTHMLDGQNGPLIVRDSPANDPHYNLYDDDSIVIHLNDWMHQLSFEHYPGLYRNHTGQEPDNYLINGLGTFTDKTTNQTTAWGKWSVFHVQKGKRYRMRMINSFSTVCLAELKIEGHRLTVIAQDGANVKPKVVDSIVSATGERVDFILYANQSVNSYWIQVRGLEACGPINPIIQYAVLIYNKASSQPSSPPPSYANNTDGVIYNGLNATKCNTNDTSTVVCVNQVEAVVRDTELLKVVPDARHILPFWFFSYTLSDGDKSLFAEGKYPPYLNPPGTLPQQLLSTINNISYLTPPATLLSQSSSVRTVCKPNQLSSCTQPCSCTQVINAKLNDVVELLIYDADPVPFLHHPFHLHGYEFKVFSIGQFDPTKNITASDVTDILKDHTERLKHGSYRSPPGKDTVKIPNGGWAIIRFKADNPGYWLLHCHFSWHHITGMELAIHVGSNLDLPLPPVNFPQCDNWTPPPTAIRNFFGDISNEV